MYWLIAVLALAAAKEAKPIAERLQECSVTIKSDTSEGSGVLVTLPVESTAAKRTENITFVVTAAHVVAGLRSVRTVVEADGKTKRKVEFRDASLVKELNEAGRRVGELKMDARVLKYSDADAGDDVAVLMVLKRDFVAARADFLMGDKPPAIGIALSHVGSLLGQMGANSYTTGVMSQVGRVHKGKVYDQVTTPGFPGSSGGGVFLADSGLCIGTLVRGAGETFCLIVPARRLFSFAKQNQVEWVFDRAAKVPTLEEIEKMPIEREGSDGNRAVGDGSSAGKTMEHVPLRPVPVLDLSREYQP